MADLSTTINGVRFPNPILPASGPLGCDGVALRHLVAHGVGGMVAKTVSTTPAIVPKPCIQRVGKDGMLNCETWSEKSVEEWAAKDFPSVQDLRAQGIPLVASAGYSGAQIAEVVRRIAPFADVIEISTHYVKDSPEPIIEGVRAAKANAGGKPVWIKMSPHASAMAEYARAAEQAGADAIVAINSVGPCQSLDAKTGRPFLGSAGGWGWLTGAPIKPVAEHFVKLVVDAVKVPVIAVGGISTAKDVVAMLMLGASAVQICTAAMLKGPGLFRKIAEDLARHLDEQGLASPATLRGSAEGVRGDDLHDVYDAKVSVDDGARCVDCMLCVGACAYLAMHVEPGPKRSALAAAGGGPKVWIDYDRCVHCGACVSVCPAPGTLGVQVPSC